MSSTSITTTNGSSRVSQYKRKRQPKNASSSTNIEDVDTLDLLLSLNTRSSFLPKISSDPPLITLAGSTNTTTAPPSFSSTHTFDNSITAAESSSISSQEAIEQGFAHLEKHIQQKNDENQVSGAEIKAYCKEMVRIWKERSYGTWHPEASDVNHKCNTLPPRCQDYETIQKMAFSNERDKAIERHKQCVTCSRMMLSLCSMDKLCATGYKTSDGSFHVCMKNKCFSETTDARLHHQKREYIDYLYVCEQTGKEHICEKYCDVEKIAQKSNHFSKVCPISGLHFGHEIVDNGTMKSRVRHRYFIENPLKESSTKRKEDATVTMSIDTIIKNCTAPDFDLMKFKKKKTPKYLTKAIRSVKEDALTMALKKCAFIFSEKNLKSYQSSRDKLEQELSSELEKCCTTAHQNRRLPNTQQLHAVANVFFKKNYLAPDTDGLAEKHTQELLIHKYAQQCVIFWYIVTTFTDVREKHHVHFNDFIDSALSIFEEGLEVPKEDYDHPVVLIEKDKLLNILSIEQTNSRKALLRRKSCKNPAKKLRKSNETGIKNAVQSSILEAIRTRQRHPEVFRIDTYTFEDIPSTGFTLSSNRSGISPRSTRVSSATASIRNSTHSTGNSIVTNSTSVVAPFEPIDEISEDFIDPQALQSTIIEEEALYDE